MTREEKIRAICEIMGFSGDLAVAVATVESAMGKYIISPTNARGLFQLTSIALKDMLQAMGLERHERVAMLCGIAFLCLLQDRWGDDPRTIVGHYADPAEKEAYWKKIQKALTQTSPVVSTQGAGAASTEPPA